MAFFRGIFFFGLVNILVMTSVTILMAIVNLFLFGEPFPQTNTLFPLLIMSCVWGSGGAVISLMISKFMAKKSMGLQMIDPQTATGTERELIDTVHRIARSAHLPEMPEVGIYNSPEVNAFATGPSKSNSLVAVSTGLLRSMDRDQVEGVLAHEVAHIANGDMVTLTLIQGIVNSFVIFFSRLVAGAIAGGENGRRNGGMEFLIVMVLQVVFGLFGNMVVCYFSRMREFRADAGGAHYAGRGKMTSALQALQRQAQAHLNPHNVEEDTLATFKISSGRRNSWLNLFSTHPPLEERIARLQSATI